MFSSTYIAKVIVVFNVLVIYNIDGVYNKTAKEQVFTDVLKNITLANKILEDLIKNYERLEKIYRSEEFVKTSSSSSEIDETFKHIFSNSPNINQRDRSYQKRSTNKPYIGTAMIYDSASRDNESEETYEEKETNELETRGKSYTLNSNVFNNKDTITNTSLVTNREKSNDNSENGASDEIEEIIIEMPKDDASVVSHRTTKSNIKSKSNKELKNILGEKTRFSVQYANPKIGARTQFSGSTIRNRSNGRRIKRIIYSEAFSPDNIWHEIIHRPIRLKEDTYPIVKRNLSHFRSENKEKVTVLIITNSGKEKSVSGPIELDSKMKENLSNLGLLKNILRNTYGEACLQIPIKKCIKALNAMSKNICKRRFKCKSDFKSDLIGKSRTACEKEFAYKEVTNNVTEKKEAKVEKFSPPVFSNRNKPSGNSRGRYKLLSQLMPIKNFISLRNETPEEAFIKLRILRDKYEKKCLEGSRKKCANACNFALNETCSIHTCEKKLKKAVKSECKDQCKKVFTNISKQSNSDSDGDSESESDSDSD